MRPKRPLGRTSSTMMIMASATVSFELGADEAHVGSDQVLGDPDQEAADHRAERAREAAHAWPRRRRRAGCRPSCSGRGRPRARPSCPPPRRTPRPAPSPAPSIQLTRMPQSRLDTGFWAAARMARPSVVKRKKSEEQGEDDQGDADRAQVVGAEDDIADLDGLARERAREGLLDVGVDPARDAVRGSRAGRG